MELTERLAQVALGIEAKVHRYVVDNRVREAPSATYPSSRSGIRVEGVECQSAGCSGIRSTAESSGVPISPSPGTPRISPVLPGSFGIAVGCGAGMCVAMIGRAHGMLHQPAPSRLYAPKPGGSKNHIASTSPPLGFLCTPASSSLSPPSMVPKTISSADLGAILYISFPPPRLFRFASIPFSLRMIAFGTATSPERRCSLRSPPFSLSLSLPSQPAPFPLPAFSPPLPRLSSSAPSHLFSLPPNLTHTHLPLLNVEILDSFLSFLGNLSLSPLPSPPLSISPPLRPQSY